MLCIRHGLTCDGRLDVKGYKKDLRKAHAKIESLQALSGQRPPTPDGESATSGKSNPSPETKRRQLASPLQYVAESSQRTESGLGISVTETSTTTKNDRPSPTPTAFLSPTPTSKFSAIWSPPQRPKSPLRAHKKLPKPPAPPNLAPLPKTPPPPLPGIKLQRQETLRSLSESIISSYTKRSPPEQDSYTTPPSRDRSSAPLQPAGPQTVPLSKFATPPPTTPRPSMTNT